MADKLEITDPDSPLISWDHTWAEFKFDLDFNAAAETAVCTVAAGDHYGWHDDTNGKADTGSIADEVDTAIEGATGLSVYGITGVVASYVSDRTAWYPRMRFDITVTGSPSDIVLVQNGSDDPLELGFRLTTLTPKLPLVDQTGGVWRLETNAPWRGIWTPHLDGCIDDDLYDTQARMTQNPFSSADYAQVRAGDLTRRSLHWRHVPGLFISPDKMAKSSFIAQAGATLLTYETPTYGHLENLIDAMGRTKAMRIYTAAATYTQVHRDASQALTTGGIATVDSTGGSRYDVRLLFVED